MKTMQEAVMPVTYGTTKCASLIVLAIAVGIIGCSKTITRKSPPKEQVQDVVRANLPAFLSLESIDLEPINTGPEAVKVNFKATVTPKEDLYQVDREVEGTPRVTLLKVVQATGTRASLYGFVLGQRTVDKWTLEQPMIETGLRQFGQPRAAFDAQSYVTGTESANEALRQQASNADKIAKAKEAARLERERERKALEEQKSRDEEARKKREEEARIELERQRAMAAAQQKADEEKKQQEAEAARQQLLLATVPGACYSGTIIAFKDYEHERIAQQQRIRIVFTEQKDFAITAEVNNPDDPKQKETFAGELVFDAKSEKDGTSYPIRMSKVGKMGNNYSLDYFAVFYSRPGPLKLRLSEKGMNGDAELSMIGTVHLEIHLQREK